MSTAAVVVAAGQGVRFGSLKQFLDLDGETVAARSVRAARSVADLVVAVVPKDYEGDGEGADLVVVGGETRAASVRAGLACCPDADVVVVHDAARPLASAALFHAVVDAVRAGADGAVPGLAVTDTLKRVVVSDDATIVVETLERAEIVGVQTPQAFRREVLVRAHVNDDEASDDAALVEALGARVVVVPGEPSNQKITRPGDVAVLRALLEAS